MQGSAAIMSPKCLLNDWRCLFRFELPTDDNQYEKKKERAAEEAELSAGAAHALSHNEFMYT